MALWIALAHWPARKFTSNPCNSHSKQYWPGSLIHRCAFLHLPLTHTGPFFASIQFPPPPVAQTLALYLSLKVASLSLLAPRPSCLLPRIIEKPLIASLYRNTSPRSPYEPQVPPTIRQYLSTHPSLQPAPPTLPTPRIQAFLASTTSDYYCKGAPRFPSPRTIL